MPYFLDEVCDAIKRWRPGKGFERETQFRDHLLDYLNRYFSIKRKKNISH